MIAVFFWTGFALFCGSVLLVKRNIELVKCVVLGTIYYFMFYVVASGLLFLFGQFSIKRVTFLNFLIGGILFACFAVKNRQKEPLSLLPVEKKSWLSYLIIATLLIVFSGSFGYFGMGQDEGVYQVEAINIANGRNEWLTTFSEYDQITDEEYKDFYREAVDAIPGVELVDVEYGFRDAFQIPQLGGLDVIYHGIPTYPAILALAIKLFGMEHMMLFQSFFYVSLLLLVEILLREHSVHWVMRSALVLVLGISPEVLWIRKSTLTEMFLAVLLTYYLFKVIDKDDKQKSLSVFPVVAFSFFHASAFSILPILVLNYWALYLVKKDIRFIRNALEALVGFCIGFIMMFRVEPIYMAKNFMRLMEQKGVYFAYKWIPLAVIIVSVAVGIAGFALQLIKKVKRAWIIWTEYVVVFIISAVSIVDFLSGRPWSWNIRLIGISTLMAYVTLTGFFLVPVILVGLMIMKHKYEELSFTLTANLFAWTVLIYSVVLRMQVIWYYYYSRYIVPFIPIVVILFGLFFTDSNVYRKKSKRVLAWALFSILLVGIVFLVPFSNVIRKSQDDTNVQWSTLSDVMNNVSAGDVVLMDQNEMWYFFYPVRSKGALVYPVMGDFETTLEKAKIDKSGQRLYYISEDRSYEDDWKYEVVYESKSKYQLDDQMHYVEYLRLPTEFAQKGVRSHVLYHWVTPETQINAVDDNFGRGWSVTNAAGYRWMCEKKASLSAYLQQDDWLMTIQQGDAIPFELISANEVRVDVFINGHELEPMIFSGETKGKEFRLDIPSEYVEEGGNEISFLAENTWSPKEYGEADPSQYAFSVANIWFERME